MSASLPKQLYSCEQTRELDRMATAEAGIPEIVLMKRAGRAAFEFILQNFPDKKSIIVVCGGGNNGGDGYIVAALAAQRKLSVSVFSSVDTNGLTGGTKRAYDYAVQEGVEVRDISEFVAEGTENTIIVDAILGIGLKGGLRQNLRNIMLKINASGICVLALDIPSGLDGDSGCADDDAIKADKTITFVGLKRGLFTAKGPQLCGEIHFDGLAIPQEIYARVSPSCERIADVNCLPPRRMDAHKGDCGHVLVVGGELGTGGAAILAAEAALRSGAGLVSLATRPEHVSAALSRVPEIMVTGLGAGAALSGLVDKADVIVIGPGLGHSSWSQQLLYFALKSEKPMVVDADGLNLIAKKDALDVDSSRWVITPHPGEAARLLRCTSADIQTDRFAAVERLQRRFGCVVLLKGAGTLISSGDSHFLANVGNPGMAVSGMGDVLSGMIGAAMGQGLSPMDAAATAVCAHGCAGDMAAKGGRIGLKASDLLPHIRNYLSRGADK